MTKRAPTEQELADCLFAWTVAKHVKSNAIVYAKDGATAGIGAGQMNRLESARIAAWKAKDAAERAGWPEPRTIGSAVASDAFFPFADGLLAAVEAGATAVIQPGGSIRDEEVIAAADEAGLAMVFTGMRHFRHEPFPHRGEGSILRTRRGISPTTIPASAGMTADGYGVAISCPEASALRRRASEQRAVLLGEAAVPDHVPKVRRIAGTPTASWIHSKPPRQQA